MIRTPGHRYSDAEVKRLQAAAERSSGETIGQVAAALGVTRRAAYSKLNRLRERHRKPKTWSYPEIKRVISMAEEGQTYKAIGEAFGVSYSSIRGVLHNHAGKITVKATCGNCTEAFTYSQGGRAKNCPACRASSDARRARQVPPAPPRRPRRQRKKQKPRPGRIWTRAETETVKRMILDDAQNQDVAAAIGVSMGLLKKHISRKNLQRMSIASVCEVCDGEFICERRQRRKCCGPICDGLRKNDTRNARRATWRAQATPEELEQARLDANAASRKSRAKAKAQNIETSGERNETHP